MAWVSGTQAANKAESEMQQALTERLMKEWP
jgi:hypothetical protein